MDSRQVLHESFESVLRDADQWAIQRLRQKSTTFGVSDSWSQPYICSSCREIDWAKSIQYTEEYRSEQYRRNSDTVLRDKHPLDLGCAICDLLYHHVFIGGSNRLEVPSQLSLRFRPAYPGCLYIDKPVAYLFRSMPRALLYPGHGSEDLRAHIYDAEASSCGYLGVIPTSQLEDYITDPQVAIGPRSHLRPPTYNPALVKCWQRHTGVEPPCSPYPTRVSGMRLIDCKELAVVDRRADMKYLALSYVWTLANKDIISLRGLHHDMPPSSTRPGSLPDHIPRVVADAMTVTTDLGYRYLWVDQFCIDQKAEAKVLADHISKMDQVYMSAVLTIIAASTSGALPGVRDIPRIPQKLLSVPPQYSSDQEETAGFDETGKGGVMLFTTSPHFYDCVRHSAWYQRGWCFQEAVLSSARLYFTDYETVFQTSDTVVSETYPEPHELLNAMLDGWIECLSLNEALWKKRTERGWATGMYSLEDPRGQFWAALPFFFELLEAYTSKDLTMDADSINGFRGVLKFFSRMAPGFGTMIGLPIYLPEIAMQARHEIEEPSSSKTRISDSQAECNITFLTTREDQQHFESSISQAHDRSTSNDPIAARTIRFQQECLAAMLLWHHEYDEMQEDQVIRRRPGFPSWSWAGWRGKVANDYHTFSMSPSTIMSPSTSSVLPTRPFDWQIKALELKDGKVLNLQQNSKCFFSQHTLQLDSATCLIGEAYILPYSNILLSHSASNLATLSRTYRVSRVVARVLQETSRWLSRLENSARSVWNRVVDRPRWLGQHLRMSPSFGSRLMPYPESSALKRSFYHFSHYLWFSNVAGILQKFHTSSVHMSSTELAKLPQNSALLEQELCAKLDDGTWELLVANRGNCLVVQRLIHDSSSKETSGSKAILADKYDGTGSELRRYTRVGLLRFKPYLGWESDGSCDTAASLSSAEKIYFRLG